MTSRVRRPADKNRAFQVPRANGLERNTAFMAYTKDGAAIGCRCINNGYSLCCLINNAGEIRALVN